MHQLGVWTALTMHARLQAEGERLQEHLHASKVAIENARANIQAAKRFPRLRKRAERLEAELEVDEDAYNWAAYSG